MYRNWSAPILFLFYFVNLDWTLFWNIRPRKVKILKIVIHNFYYFTIFIQLKHPGQNLFSPKKSYFVQFLVKMWKTTYILLTFLQSKALLCNKTFIKLSLKVSIYFPFKKNSSFIFWKYFLVLIQPHCFKRVSGEDVRLLRKCRCLNFKSPFILNQFFYLGGIYNVFLPVGIRFFAKYLPLFNKQLYFF